MRNGFTRALRSCYFHEGSVLQTRARRLMATSSADCSARIWRTSDLPSNLLERGAEQAVGARTARSEAGRRQRPVTVDEEGGRRERDAVGKRELVLRPIAVLRDPTSRWMWDCAFAADSQYLFTGVLSAPTAFCLTYRIVLLKSPLTYISRKYFRTDT